MQLVYKKLIEKLFILLQIYQFYLNEIKEKNVPPKQTVISKRKKEVADQIRIVTTVEAIEACDKLIYNLNFLNDTSAEKKSILIQEWVDKYKKHKGKNSNIISNISDN